jgi:hypothetical protein
MVIMQDVSKVQHLTALIARLQEHLSRVGDSPDFRRELEKAEAELRAIEERKQPPR